MKKSNAFLTALMVSTMAFSGVSYAANKAPASKAEATTRSDAVIFKVHDIAPVLDEGVVTGCDFTVTLYNRTDVNFRSFTINMQWNDVVDERFKFDRYLESYLGKEEIAAQKELSKEEPVSKPLQTSITVNAFGADKQISVRSHVNSEKCYLMLSNANYTVTPCDVARKADGSSTTGIENNNCTKVFQFVNTSNPEYFGQFKNMSASEIAAQNRANENRELSGIDEVISKIVENLGASDETLKGIN